MVNKKYNVQEIASKLQAYSPFDIAELDKEYFTRTALFRGRFPWHMHEMDEFFMVLKGKMDIEMRGSKVTLNEARALKVNSGVKHRPYCYQEAIMLLAMNKKIRVSKANFFEVKDKI